MPGKGGRGLTAGSSKFELMNALPEMESEQPRLSKNKPQFDSHLSQLTLLFVLKFIYIFSQPWYRGHFYWPKILEASVFA